MQQVYYPGVESNGGVVVLVGGGAGGGLALAVRGRCEFVLVLSRQWLHGRRHACIHETKDRLRTDPYRVVFPWQGRRATSRTGPTEYPKTELLM